VKIFDKLFFITVSWSVSDMRLRDNQEQTNSAFGISANQWTLMAVLVVLLSFQLQC